MIKIYCDNCKQEANDKDFRFEARLQEIKQSLLTGAPRPQLTERIVHLCQKCYKKKLDL